MPRKKRACLGLLEPSWEGLGVLPGRLASRVGTAGSGQNTVRIRNSEGVPFSFGFWSGPAGPVSEDPETPGVGARLAGSLPAEGRPGSCPSSCYSNRPSPPGTGAQREEGGCGGTQRGWPAGGGPQGGGGPRSVLAPVGAQASGRRCHSFSVQAAPQAALFARDHCVVRTER